MYNIDVSEDVLTTECTLAKATLASLSSDTFMNSLSDVFSELSSLQQGFPNLIKVLP